LANEPPEAFPAKQFVKSNRFAFATIDAMSIRAWNKIFLHGLEESKMVNLDVQGDCSSEQ